MFLAGFRGGIRKLGQRAARCRHGLGYGCPDDRRAQADRYTERLVGLAAFSDASAAVSFQKNVRFRGPADRALAVAASAPCTLDPEEGRERLDGHPGLGDSPTGSSPRVVAPAAIAELVAHHAGRAVERVLECGTPVGGANRGPPWMTVEPASRTRRPDEARSRLVVRAPAGICSIGSVNDRRGQAVSRHHQRRLCQTNSDPLSP